MKKYTAPQWEAVLLSPDVLMASSENELALDRLSAIFDL